MAVIKPTYKKAKFLQLLFGKQPTAKGLTIWRASFICDRKYSLWAKLENLPDALLESVVEICGGTVSSVAGKSGEVSFAAVMPKELEVEIACENKSRPSDITHLRSLDGAITVVVPYA